MSTGTGKQENLLRNIIFILAMTCLALAVYSGIVVIDKNTKDQANLQSVAELRVQALRIPQLANNATAGDELAFNSLSDLQGDMHSVWGRLQKRLSSEGEVSSARVKSAARSWDKVREGVQSLGDNREPVLFVSKVANELNAKLPELQDNSQQVVDALIANSAPTGQVTIAQEQLWLIERIGRNIDKMLAGSEDASVAADQFKNDSNVFHDTLDAMKNGNFILGISKVTDRDAVASINVIEQSFNVVSNDIDRIHQSADELSVAQNSANALVGDVPALLTQLDQLDYSITALATAGGRVPNNTTTLIATGVFLLLLVVLGFLNYRATRQNLYESERVKDKNQQAILRLLDEISDLADGDLTVEATVTEDFTGTIADSINFAISELRSLVQNVAGSSERVAESTDATRATSLQLAESAEHQAQEIAGASAAINEMAITIDQVSSNSSESAAVAERSVSIAKNGAQVVRNTIDGMDTIREQIQDTSKRIKRLGESSQEIGDIVSLINEIADQTNILALNAAIQAAMAGEAGRGFAVVADEVQRLAERSATATKQIAGLVKTIQTDTNEAVASMEQTTSEVVKGAELANSAGIALEEIENVSTHLAELIQDISEAAKHQATTSAHISNTMNVIQEITSQTLAGTNDTARSIGDLAGMAVEMRESVSGFILPREEQLNAQAAETQVVEESPDDVEEEIAAVESESAESAAEDEDIFLGIAEEVPEKEAPDFEQLSDPGFDVLGETAQEAETEETETDSIFASESEDLEPVELPTPDEPYQDYQEESVGDTPEEGGEEDLVQLEQFEAEIEAMLKDEAKRN